MKRLNLIHGALIAVLTFMGTISLSAQQNWLPPVQAAAVITSELDVLESPAPPPTKVAGNYNQTSVGPVGQPTGKLGGCPDCMLNGVKTNFLKQVLLRIKEGSPTDVAVSDVYTMMLNGSNNDPTLLQVIQNAYNYVVDLLT